MRYLGNKTRLAKEISPFLVKYLNGENWYIEPFAGAFGMISNIKYEKRIAYDKDKYIIELMKAVRDGWTPQYCNELRYKIIQDYLKTYNPALTFTDAEIAFAGYGCSFGGKWFGGYARGGISSTGKLRSHSEESIRNLEKMRPLLQGIKMQVSEYDVAKVGEGNLIYCDPPYSTGTQYKSAFDSEKFWEWVRTQSAKNYIFVSEYNAPEDFMSVWEKEHKSGIDNNAKTHKQTVEKLFTWNNTRSMVYKENMKRLGGG